MAGRRVLLVVALVLAAVLLAFLHGPTPTPPALAPTPVTPPAQQPVEAPVGVNVTQPQVNVTQPAQRARLIVAVVEAGGGGRVLVNGTEASTWNSTRPFTLLLKAVPDTCYAFDHWEVNGTEHSGPDLALAIAGNTTVRAVFYKPLYTVTINTNATGAAAQINGENYTLPTSLRVPACSTVEVKPLETPLYKPLNTTLAVTVKSDTSITLSYAYKVRSFKVPALIGGKLQQVEVVEAPFTPSRATVEVEEDGWIHVKGRFASLLIYIPWNYTHVAVHIREVKPPPGMPLTDPMSVYRYCEWGADPFAYGHGAPIHWCPFTINFTGCIPDPGGETISGKRYDFEQPGALRIDITGEAWIKIEAYP